MAEIVGEPLRVGIVGAGIGAGYAAGFQKQRGVEVTAICARTPTRIAAVALRCKIARSYAVYEEMLAQEPLDVVAIATPNYLHHPMVLAALEAGKHVLCDKPLAMNLVQAREMVAKAESSGRKHFVPFTWRFVPAGIVHEGDHRFRDISDSCTMQTFATITADGEILRDPCAGSMTGSWQAVERSGTWGHMPFT